MFGCSRVFCRIYSLVARAFLSWAFALFVIGALRYDEVSS
jgi:hypothetical protein